MGFIENLLFGDIIKQADEKIARVRHNSKTRAGRRYGRGSYALQTGRVTTREDIDRNNHRFDDLMKRVAKK